jgi:uncharacterized protein
VSRFGQGGNPCPGGSWPRSARLAISLVAAVAALLPVTPVVALPTFHPLARTDAGQHLTIPGEAMPPGSKACPTGIPESSFVDRGGVHGRAIDCLVAYGIVQGTSSTSFGTDEPLTRRQGALVLTRMLEQLPGLTLPPGPGGRFPDVGENAFTSAIETLASLDPPIVRGFPDGTFRPFGPVSRAQLASFLGRSHEEVARQFPRVTDRPAAAETGFPDIAITDTHGINVAQLADLGVIVGLPDGTFGPVRPVTRGQLASFVARQLELYAQAGVLRQLPGLDPDPPIVPSEVDVRGSVEQVIVVGADPNSPVSLHDPAGRLVASDPLAWSIDGQDYVSGGKTTDRNGSIIFRGTLDDNLAYSGVPPGTGYTVGYVEDGEPRTSEPVTVLSGHGSTPPGSFYAGQVLEEGFGYIQTRDGTLLSTMVRLPGPADQGPYPVMVEYSGYSPSQPYDNLLGANGTTMAIGELLGYATVAVNIRGSGCSGGAFDYFETLQGLDGYDVVETVAAQPWSGNVGTTGVSYPGISQLFVAATQPPNLTAAAPVAIISDHARDTVYPGGIYNTGFAREWAEERERDTRFPGGQGWVDRAVAGNDPLMSAEDAATCRQNVQLRDQNMPLLDRIQANEFESELWSGRAPFDFAQDITTNLYIAVSSQDEQTGGRASAILEALDLQRDDRIVRFTGTNGTHVEALGPELLTALVEFLELYLAERTPILTERSDWNQLAFALSLVYSQTLGAGVPSGPQLAQLFPQDRFTGMSYEDALAAFESEPPAQILYENGAGGGPAGFPLPSFTERFEFDELPNLDAGFDADANSWFLHPDGVLGRRPPDVRHGAADDHSVYVYDPSRYPPYSFGDTRPSNSEVWLLQPAYHWAQPPEGAHLSFVSPALTEDTLTFGSASVDLWLDSDLDDTDLEVALSEIRPDGQEMYVTTGWLRASKRHLDHLSTALRPRPTFRVGDAAPLAEGWNEVRVETFPFGHAFREGSRVRLTIEAPGGNRPTWRFDDTIGGGPDVRNRISHSQRFASKLVLPVIASRDGIATGLPGCEDSTTTDGFTSVRGQPCRSAPER